MSYPLADVSKYWATATPSVAHHRAAHDQWDADGKKHRDMAKRLCEPGSVLEWGVGGGMNPAHIKARPYYAVDILESSLAQAARYGVDPILIEVADPLEKRLKLPRVDLFISTAVYQHFPSIEYARRVTEYAAQIAKYALIQIRGTRNRPSRNYARDVCTACTWTVAEFATLLEGCGFRVNWTERGPADYVYFGCQRA
jgi:hypothetical protein